MNELLNIAVDAARVAGAMLRTASVSVDAHLGRDIKLQQDRDAEALIVERLSAVEGIELLAEEEGGELPTSGPCWVVDPLDGSYNHYRGLPDCAVAIGLWDQRPLVGVIYDFHRDAMYTGFADGGAWLNGDPIGVSGIADCASAVLATGFPTGTDFSDAGLARAISPYARFRKVRMIGSACMALARVAEGRFDIYSERDIMPWDVIAGMALVQGAGGHTRWESASHRNGAWNLAAAADAQLFKAL